MKKQFRLHAIAIAVAGSLTAAEAMALDPQGIKLADAATLVPKLEVRESYDDNIRATESNEKSSWVTSIAPTLTVGAEGNKAAYNVSYTAQRDIFHSSHKDDNTDHHLVAELDLVFDARNRLDLEAGYHVVEELDTENLNTNGENDKYNTKNLGGMYTFGAEGAAGRIELAADYEELRYTNDQHVNADQERDSTRTSGTFYYRVAPKTYALIEGRYADHSYVSNDLRDSEDTAVLLGATWEATARTTGSVKIGAQEKDFDDSSVDDKSGTTWDVAVDWRPRSYSLFTARTGSRFEEGTSGASTVDTRDYELSWTHDWRSDITSELSYLHVNRDYKEVDRDDDLDVLQFELNYSMRRWLDLGVGYRYADNDSNLDGESYERNIYYMSMSVSL